LTRCSRPGAIALVADRTAAYVSFEYTKRSSSSDTPKIGFLAALARLCPEPLNTPVALGHRFDSIDKTYIGAISDNVVPPPFQNMLADHVGRRFAPSRAITRRSLQPLTPS
jgi:hypothetical protein